MRKNKEWYEIKDKGLEPVHVINRDVDIMKYIETEMVRVNEECGRLHFDCALRLWQDKQLELETIERIYEELNNKFF